MADNTTIFGLDLETQQANAKLATWVNGLTKASKSMEADLKRLQDAMERYARDYARLITKEEAALKKLQTTQKGTAKTRYTAAEKEAIARVEDRALGLERRSDGARGTARRNFAAGGEVGRDFDAVLQNRIGRIMRTAEVFNARITKATADAMVLTMRNAAEQVEARLAAENRKLRNDRLNNTAEQDAAQRRLDDANRVRRARNASPTAITADDILDQQRREARDAKALAPRYKADTDRAIEELNNTAARQGTRLSKAYTKALIETLGDTIEDAEAAVNQAKRRIDRRRIANTPTAIAEQDRLDELARDKRSIAADPANITAERILAQRRAEDRADAALRSENVRSTTRQINAIKETEGQQGAKLNRAMGDAAVNLLKDSVAYSEARLRDAERQIERSIRRNSPEGIAAQRRRDTAADLRNRINSDPAQIEADGVLARRSAQDRQYQATNGRAAFQNQQTLNRVSDPSFLGVQARLLANYAGISTLFAGARNLGTFIVQLDKEFRQFQAISETTNTTMKSMKTTIIEVSQATKFTAVEIAQAATVMAQAGLSAKQVSDSIGAVAQLATAAGTELADAVGIVTSVLNIFDLQTTQTGDIADTMTAALNRSKLTLEQLTLGMQYAGNTAASLGISFGETTAILGALAQSGIRSGSTLGTGLRQILIDLETPSNKFRAVLERLGITMADIDVESNGFVGVLANLRDAGFSTGDAFESFEVRAAAAFTALSNNSDVILDLQESFLLSNAAAAANEIQMESLANTWNRAGNSIGSTVYTAFEPFLALLQDVLAKVADLFAWLGRFPGVLQGIAAAVAGLGVAWAAAKIGGLATFAVRGIMGAGAAAAGAGAIGTAAASSTGLLSRLFTTIRGGLGPVSLLIGAAAAVYTAFKAFGGQVETLTDQYDRFKTRVNETNGVIDASEQRIQSVQETVQHLIVQEQVLDRIGNEGLRRAKILEVKQAFSELAGEVDTSIGTINDLIDALVRLENQMVNSLPEAFEAQVANLELLIANIEDRITAETTDAENTNRLMNAFDPGARGLFGDEATNYLPMVNDLFGEDIRRAAELGVTGFDPAMPEDSSDLNRLSSRLSTEIANREYRIAQEDLTQGQLTALNAQIRILEAIEANFTGRRGLEDERTSNVNLRRQNQSAGLQATFDVQSQGDANTINYIRQALAERMRAVDGDDAMSAVDKVAAYQAILDQLISAETGALDRANARLAALAAANPDQDVLGTVNFNEIETAFATMRSALTEAIADPLERAQAIEKFLLEDQVTDDNRALQQAMARFSDSGATEAQRTLEEQIINALAQRIATAKQRLLEMEFDREYGGDPAGLELGQMQLASELAREKAERWRVMRDARAASQLGTSANIAGSNLSRQSSVLNLAITGRQGEINTLMTQLDRAQTQEDFDLTVAQIMALREQISELKRELFDVEYQAGNGDIVEAWNGQAELEAEIAAEEEEFATLMVDKKIALINEINAVLVENLQTQAEALQAEMERLAASITEFSPADTIAFIRAQIESLGLQLLAINGQIMQNGAGPGALQGPGDTANMDPADLALVQSRVIGGGVEVQGISAALGQRLARAIRAAEEATGAFATITSLYRSAEEQAQLYADYMQEIITYNGVQYEPQVGPGVQGLAAPPGSSLHQSGNAVDVAAGPVLDWLHANAGAYGLEFLTGDNFTNDPGHMQLAGAAAMNQPVAAVTTQVDATARAATNYQAAQVASLAAQAVNEQIAGLATQLNITRDPEAATAIFEQIQTLMDDLVDREMEAFRAENAEAPNLEAMAAARALELQNEVAGSVGSLLDQYMNVVGYAGADQVRVAQANLSAAEQYPANYTEAEMAQLRLNVANAEAAQVTALINGLEQARVYIQEQLAEARAAGNQPLVNDLMEREAAITQDLIELQDENIARTRAQGRAHIELADALKQAYTNFLITQGVMRLNSDGIAEMIPVAEQVATTVEGLLNTMASGFATLFSDLVTGTVSIKEAFKKFALSTIQYLIQVIAKALALQLIMKLFPGMAGGTGGGGFFGKLLTGLFAVPAAANGDLVTGGIPGRDSVLRKVMPGEMILRRSAVSAIGTEALREINNQGSRHMSAVEPLNAPPPAGGGVVNVWVVPADQVPPTGPNDIVAAIADNISRKGVVKTLIRQVQMGAI